MTSLNSTQWNGTDLLVRRLMTGKNVVVPVTREGLTNKDLRRLGLIIKPSGVGQQLANEACKREDLHLKWLIRQDLDCH